MLNTRGKRNFFDLENAMRITSTYKAPEDLYYYGSKF